MSRRPMEFFEPDDGAGEWTVREHSPWRLYWRTLRPRLWPIAQSIVMTLLYMAFTFIAVLVSLCLGRSVPFHRHMRLGMPRRHRPRF